MRLTLIDLMIVLVLLNLGTAPCLLLKHLFPEAILLGFPLGIVFVLWGGSWLYRRLKLRPMLLPRCPHCRAQEKFLPVDLLGSRWRMICCNCRGAFIYWTSTPPLEYRPGALAEVQVGFPYLFGPTRVTWPGDSSLERLPELTGESAVMQLRSNHKAFHVREIAPALTGDGCKLLQTDLGIAVKSQTAQIRLQADGIEIEMFESDCAIAKAQSTLRVRGWLEALNQSYGPIRANFEGQWRDLAELLESG